MLELFHYVHCPFCVRVRMALGFLRLPYTSTVLRYNDEATPIQLTGKKMLPIMKFPDMTINESLDIIKKLDSKKQLSFDFLDKVGLALVEDWLKRLGAPIHNLCMPYWVWTPEFDQPSRQYFENKKSAKRGPFAQLAQARLQFESELNPLLKELEAELEPFFHNRTMTIVDIMLAAHLWGLYILPEFRFSDKLHAYLQSIKQLCEFDYHIDFWRQKEKT
ncbi:MAG: glutathione S-transferase N-terminal domain-containing protein [Bdellovibrio sp.]|nr:glutathione S-transferase N-terminal domain-containing protein [Bdellovibrio sp.]